MMPENVDKEPSMNAEEPLKTGKTGVRAFIARLRKRRIIETLAAFIGGGWLLVEIVERLLVSHYKLPGKAIDLTVLSVIGALLATLVWRWFSGTEKRLGNIKVEILLVPLIALATLALDLIILFEILGISINTFLIAIVFIGLGIAWIIVKSLQWAAMSSGLATRRVEGRTGDSIVVLPFKNLSADPEQEYFCEGMSEELINALTQIKGLRVVARTSAFSFKGKDVDIREIGAKLNVEKALEGSVRKSGQRLRITAQLVTIEDGCHVWSDQFDREMKDVFAIQEEISRAIVDKLKVDLFKDQKGKLVKHFTEDHEAYNIYLQGRYFWYRRYEGGLQKGLEFFQQAIHKDPLYSLAYVGIADSFGTLGLFNFLPPREAYPRAKAAAQRALEIDPGLAEAHASLGWISMFYDWDWPAADEHFRKAITTNPDYALAHNWYGMCLAITGQFGASIAQMRKGRELDPPDPLTNAMLGWSLYMARRFDESIEHLRNVIEMDPNFSIVYWYQAGNYAAIKMWDEAIATAQKLVQLSGGAAFALATLGQVYGLAGRNSEARNVRERLNGISQERYVSPLDRAFLALGLGETDEVFENLERAYSDRASLLVFLKPWMIYDSVRADPRFKTLLEKMHLD